MTCMRSIWARESFLDLSLFARMTLGGGADFSDEP